MIYVTKENDPTTIGCRESAKNRTKTRTRVAKKSPNLLVKSV